VGRHRLAKALSLVVNHSLAISQLLTIRARCTPSRIVKIDPYLLAMLPNVMWVGSAPFEVWLIVSPGPSSVGVSKLTVTD
jgi:hypothetical protein